MEDILDVVNWLGVIQTGRRGAQIALFPYGEQGWRKFAHAKNRYWENNPQRAQSNNSLVFYDKPSREALVELFDIMVINGGSEPGFLNAVEAMRRAPWMLGVNPCAEILLPNKGFCNLVEINLAAFKDDPHGLERAVYLAARANYRQTLVNLDDTGELTQWPMNSALSDPRMSQRSSPEEQLPRPWIHQRV
jgi:ribonucleoside-triphosphate reductase